MSATNKTKDAQLVDRQNMVIATLAGKLGHAKVKLCKLQKDIDWMRKMNSEHGNALDELRIAVLDAIPLIEEAIGTMDRHDIEIAGLNGALADLQTLSE